MADEKARGNSVTEASKKTGAVTKPSDFEAGWAQGKAETEEFNAAIAQLDADIAVIDKIEANRKELESSKSAAKPSVKTPNGPDAAGGTPEMENTAKDKSLPSEAKAGAATPDTSASAAVSGSGAQVSPASQPADKSKAATDMFEEMMSTNTLRSVDIKTPTKGRHSSTAGKDVNKNETLEKSEVDNYVARHSKEHKTDENGKQVDNRKASIATKKEIFDTLDANGDGIVTRKEIEAPLRAAGVQNVEQAVGIVQDRIVAPVEADLARLAAAEKRRMSASGSTSISSSPIDPNAPQAPGAPPGVGAPSAPVVAANAGRGAGAGR